MPVSLKLLEEVKLRITSIDHDGIADVDRGAGLQAVRGPRIDARVPRAGRGWRRSSVTLDGEGEEPEHRARRSTWRRPRRSRSTASTRTDKIEDLHLAKFGAGLRDRTARPHRRAEAGPAGAGGAQAPRLQGAGAASTLKTDAHGPRDARAAGGHRRRVTATGPEGTAHTWNLPTDQHTYRQVMHAKAGDAVTRAVPRHRRQADRATSWRCSKCAAATSVPTSSTRSRSRTACSSCAACAPATTTCG